MAIPTVSKQDILNAMKFVDEKGVPAQNQSTVYDFVSESGKKYPPRYLVAVADHLAHGTEISEDGFNSVTAKKILESLGFVVETRQLEKFTLTIDADKAESTDARFTMDDLTLGDNYKPLDAYFKRADGSIVRRAYNKGERRNSNQTMPRLAFQLFEKQIANLSVEEKENFPVCRYRPGDKIIRGIFSDVKACQEHSHSTLQNMTYDYDNGRQFVIYCWNLFSTILFAQECLKRFGEQGDQFVLTYRDKAEEDPQIDDADKRKKDGENQSHGYLNPYSELLLQSKNLIFHGAPGTGKSYLAKEIAADIISNGYYDDYSLLSDEQKRQVEFVQFHPSYDYTDFVEGLRPKTDADGTMGFELQDGIFKKFVDKARKNYEDSQKSEKTREKELSVQDSMAAFLSDIEFGVDEFSTSSGNKFTITNADDKHIEVYIPDNPTIKKLKLYRDEITKMLESGQKFTKIKDITNFFGKTSATQGYSYDFAIYKEIKARKNTTPKRKTSAEKMKKYIFIIDEINRGEISKIFGELFYAIDPGYRGKAGEIATQYSNLHDDPDYKFYVPENVYIIGTMNDIDRSVDSFDFAMRRRFRFVNLKADDCLEMLANLNDDALEAEAIRRMAALNKEIANVEDLNENYQIGASYFLKLKELSFDQLWTDYLQPLLQEYIQGMYGETEIMNRFARAYGYQKPSEGDKDEADQNQG